MESLSKSQLLESLERVRQSVCCYMNSTNFCDCKFGVAKRQPGESYHGEQTGCCEVRVAMGIISAMTDAEYVRVTRRIAKSSRTRLDSKSSFCDVVQNED